MNMIFLSDVFLIRLQRCYRYYYIYDSAHCVQHCFDAETAGHSQYLSADILPLLSQVIRPCIAPHTFFRFITTVLQAKENAVFVCGQWITSRSFVAS